MQGEGVFNEKKKLTDENTLCVVSFSSSRKRASIAIRNPGAPADREVRIYTKGAPDMILDTTTKVILANGSIADINDTV